MCLYVHMRVYAYTCVCVCVTVRSPKRSRHSNVEWIHARKVFTNKSHAKISECKSSRPLHLVGMSMAGRSASLASCSPRFFSAPPGLRTRMLAAWRVEGGATATGVRREYGACEHTRQWSEDRVEVKAICVTCW